jgi:hypothetical protein
MKQSPVFTKTYDLLLWLIPATAKWPRTQRHLLTRRVQEAALNFQDLILRAGLSPNEQKDPFLSEADIELARLRFYLRLCQDLHFLSMGQYEHVMRMVTEVGRLLGGWRKSLGAIS